MSDIDVAVGEAVERAQETFDAADKNPLDHGFAHMDVDGRTRLAGALQEHVEVDASDASYVTVDGVQRYCSPQRAAYRTFVETLEEYDIDTDHVTVHARLD